MEEHKHMVVSISTGTILKIAAVFLAFWFMYLVWDVILILFISLIFASLVEPLVNRFERKKIPRGVGVIIIYVILLLFLVFVVRLLIPPIIEQVSLLATNFPQFWSRVVENFESVKQYSEQQGFLDNIQEGLSGLQSNLSRAAGGVYAFIVSVFRNIVNFVLILVITFYLVVQRDALSKSLRAVAPSKYHSYLTDLAARIQHKIGQWARGQLILGLIISVMSFLGLIFLLPRYALVLAIVAGMTELIPYLGPILGAIPAVFLGFTISPGLGLAVLILYVIIQQLENNIIVPQVMRRQVGLNPVVIILAMLVGARLVGIVGIILAIPVTTAISTVVRDFMEKSELPKTKDNVDNQSETS